MSINFRQLVVAAALSLAVTSGAIAQKADTVQYRDQETTLSDGTIVLFQIGAFGHITGSAGKPSAFIPMTNVQVDGSFLRTKPFQILSKSDSIRYVRCVYFPSPERESVEFDDSTPANEKLGALMTMAFKELSREPNVPLNTSFDASSDMLYILELRDEATNRILTRLDTIRVFKNSKGELRWRHYKQGGSGAYSAIGQYYPASVYLNVSRVDHLPPTCQLRHEFTVLDHQTGGDWVFRGNGAIMGPMASFPQAPSASVASSDVAASNSIVVVPNPADTRVQLSFTSSVTGSARVTLLNALGQVEYVGDITALAGKNQGSINIGSVPVGSYTLVISDERGEPIADATQLRISR